MQSAFVAAIVIGYLIGSIPSGVLITRRFKKVDLRKVGSGSTGATNVLRTAGPKAGIMVFFADMAKGAAAVGLAGLIVGSRVFSLGELTFDAQAGQVAAGLAAIVGHNWSLFLKFHGGKGVSTFFGAFWALSPVVALICGAVTVTAIAIWRYVSLGSLLGAICAAILVGALVYFDREPQNYLIFALPSMLLILFQHRENICRLLSGTERKLGDAATRSN